MGDDGRSFIILVESWTETKMRNKKRKNIFLANPLIFIPPSKMKQIADLISSNIICCSTKIITLFIFVKYFNEMRCIYFVLNVLNLLCILERGLSHADSLYEGYGFYCFPPFGFSSMPSCYFFKDIGMEVYYWQTFYCPVNSD